MNRALFAIAASIGAALVTAACGSSAGSGPYRATNPSTGSTGTTAATVTIANSQVGKILVDGNGKTLYLFEADRSSVSSCYNSCLTVWPALITGGTPVAGQGVNASLLTTTKRTDGTLEVVYNGHPLYYFTGDKQAGDVTGQDLNSFGALWFVLAPNGSKIG